MSIKSRLTKLELAICDLPEEPPSRGFAPGERPALMQHVADRLQVSVPELVALYERDTGTEFPAEVMTEWEAWKAQRQAQAADEDLAQQE